MSVTFSGKFVENENFGVNFEAHHDGNKIICRVSHEALQDINPPNRMDTALQQFKDNQLHLQDIAKGLIETGYVQDGFLQINSHHVAK